MDNFLRLIGTLRKSFDLLPIPDDYDHSEPNLPPHIECKFIHINSDSGGIGNFRWINTKTIGSFPRWGWNIWAGRWPLLSHPFKLKNTNGSHSP